ncbi:MAG: hypothetical protein DMG77_19565 [Acidobacteria bacterium]|nr:MAG: hypothetical protein DMG77_19565 [Acidobacteriota bacterium]
MGDARLSFPRKSQPIADPRPVGSAVPHTYVASRVVTMKSARPTSAQPQKGSSPGSGEMWKSRGWDEFRLLSQQIDYLPNEWTPDS